MKITLPKEVLDALPAPSSDDGLVRVTVGIKLGSDGSANLVEVNDTPVPTSDEEGEEAAATDDADAMTPRPPDETAAMADYSNKASQDLQNI